MAYILLLLDILIYNLTLKLKATQKGEISIIRDSLPFTYILFLGGRDNLKRIIVAFEYSPECQ